LSFPSPLSGTSTADSTNPNHKFYYKNPKKQLTITGHRLGIRAYYNIASLSNDRRVGYNPGMKLPEIKRRTTRAVDVGGVIIGGNAPIVVQIMTNTQTADAAAPITQLRQLADAGAQLVRVATPTPDDTAALAQIVVESPVPIIADVHFHFQRALEAIDAGVAKIRLNPGNLQDRDEVQRVIDAAGNAGVAIRVGVNDGSVANRRDKKQLAHDLTLPLEELMARIFGKVARCCHHYLRQSGDLAAIRLSDSSGSNARRNSYDRGNQIRRRPWRPAERGNR
jgi:hypothetical protein